MPPEAGFHAAATTRRHTLAVLAGGLLSHPLPHAQPQPAWQALGDGAIVLFRHADAPGFADPPGFRLGDCATQRNLGPEGQAQARRLGAAFRERGVRVGAVLSSQWCRARDTAELAFPGQWREAAVFNSFFETRERAPAQTAQARALLARWSGPGVLVVVTHQVNIGALTGEFVGSGDGVVLRHERDALRLLGRLRV